MILSHLNFNFDHDATTYTGSTIEAKFHWCYNKFSRWNCKQTTSENKTRQNFEAEYRIKRRAMRERAGEREPQLYQVPFLILITCFFLL